MLHFQLFCLCAWAELTDAYILISASRLRVCVCSYSLGLMQPLEGLLSMRSSQVLHLTNVNPHVVSVLTSSKYASSHTLRGSPLVRICRQSAAAALNRHRGGVACGVGSFAFQGTNGQAVMSAEPESANGPRPVVGARSELCLFDRQRFWVRGVGRSPSLYKHTAIRSDTIQYRTKSTKNHFLNKSVLVISCTFYLLD